MKVNFMIIGAMKSGTSSLASILDSHPQISFSRIKEPDYFSTCDNWKESINEYEELFCVEDGKIYGEGSTSYTKYPDLKPEIWKDIYEYNPAMKFIYLVREPLQRTISHYMHIFERGYINDTIENAILKVPELINYSRYYTQIHPYIEQFGRESVLIIDFEDFINYRRETLYKISNFLGIDFDRFENFDEVHANISVGEVNKINYRYDFLNKNPLILSFRKGLRNFLPNSFREKLWKQLTNKESRIFKQKPQLSGSFQQIVISLLRLDIIELEKLIDKDLSKWLIKHFPKKEGKFQNEKKEGSDVF